MVQPIGQWLKHFLYSVEELRTIIYSPEIAGTKYSISNICDGIVSSASSLRLSEYLSYEELEQLLITCEDLVAAAKSNNWGSVPGHYAHLDRLVTDILYSTTFHRTKKNALRSNPPQIDEYAIDLFERFNAEDAKEVLRLPVVLPNASDNPLIRLGIDLPAVIYTSVKEGKTTRYKHEFGEDYDEVPILATTLDKGMLCMFYLSGKKFKIGGEPLAWLGLKEKWEK